MNDPRVRVTQRAGAGEQEIIAALDAPTLRLLLGSDADRRDVQLIVLALVDLLGRVFPRVEVIGADAIPAHADLPPGPTGLVGRIEEARAQGTAPLPAGEPTVTVGIGNVESAADLYIDGGGWQSYLGTERSRLEPQETAIPIGALAAACRGAAHLFAQATERLFSAVPPPRSAYSSALSWQSSEHPLEEPSPSAVGALHAALVGAGSVGGAAVYALARTPGLAGELHVIDPQALEPGNFDRALLAGRPIASGRPDKANVAKDTLAHLGPALQVRPHRATIGDFVAGRPREATLPLVLCAVDSAHARRSLQDCLPLEVINAACWPSEIALSGHVTDAGPCVCCLHMRETLDGEQVRAKLIAQATGINFYEVVVMLAQQVPLHAQALRFVELRTGRPDGSLAAYEGRQLAELWREQLLYGAATLRTEEGTVVAVAAPWVTALAGVVLAAETLKSTDPETYGTWRLGPAPGSPAIKYAENPYVAPTEALLSRPDRWEGDQCLCRSPRRLSLLRERYGLDA
ncbi:MAG: hypothetical protein JWR63_2014 [Conexibacter sp.]|nr:hypothetical protein [Conexibacter sp.]